MASHGLEHTKRSMPGCLFQIVGPSSRVQGNHGSLGRGHQAGLELREYYAAACGHCQVRWGLLRGS